MYSSCQNSISQRFVQQQNNVYVRQYTYISLSLPKDRTKGTSTRDERKRCAFDFVPAGLTKFFYIPDGQKRPFQPKTTIIFLG